MNFSHEANRTVATPPYRRLADEDDELSEVQPDAVPPEVREWLASTFTRQLATTRRKADEKPKFRSVAHAIRAGIFVERISRRVTNTALMQFPPDVVRVLKVGRKWELISKLIYCNLKIHWYLLDSWRLVVWRFLVERRRYGCTSEISRLWPPQSLWYDTQVQGSTWCTWELPLKSRGGLL